MRRVLYIAEVTLPDEQADEVEGWGVEVSHFVDSVLTDHGRDRGLMIRAGAYEVEHPVLERVEKHALHLIEADQLNDFEADLLNNVACPMGNCED